MSHASYLNVEPITRSHNAFSVTAEVLRRWCVPETILAITNLFDEGYLLLHAIMQARRSGAKVLLVHVLDFEDQELQIVDKIHQPKEQSFPEFAHNTLHRMAEYMRWSGVQCEAKLLRGSPLNEIHALASTRAVDRILMAAESRMSGGCHASRPLAEDIISGFTVPVCTVSRSITHLRGSERPPGGIALAVSLHSDCTIPLAFACRLAQEHRTSLKVIHVFTEDDRGVLSIERSPVYIASRLPLSVLREAELFCPLEITVRVGDPASELLKYNCSGDQGFLVLGPAAITTQGRAEQTNVLHRVMNEACSPVITFGQIPATTDLETEKPRSVIKSPQCVRQ